MDEQKELNKSDMESNWYVLHSHPNKEEIVYKELIARGIEVYYPQICVKPVNPRSRKIKPYFPGYMFIYTNLLLVGESTFRWLPHASGLVCFGGTPSTVDCDLIIEVKKILENFHTKDSSKDFRAGDCVQVLSDLFSGYEAIFDAYISGTKRVRVLLDMLNPQKMALVLPADNIIKKKLTSPGKS